MPPVQVTSGSWMNLVMATSLIALLPVLIVFLICQRDLHCGLRSLQ